jgi:hypothetical protein
MFQVSERLHVAISSASDFRLWPGGVIAGTQNFANSMTALSRVAVVRQRYFSAKLMAAGGQQQTPKVELQLNPTLAFAGAKWSSKGLPNYLCQWSILSIHPLTMF